MGFGSLNDRVDIEEPNKSLHWSPELPRIRYPSSTISFLFSDLYTVASFPSSSEALHGFRQSEFSQKALIPTKRAILKVKPSLI